MGRITSNVGLISGIPIANTVDQLIALQARPRDLLTDLNDSLEQEQLALTDLSARLISLRLGAQKLGLESFFDQREVSSSDSTLLTATSTGTPALGSFEFTPLQTVQAHQLLSSGVQSGQTALGGGSFSVRFGGFLNSDTELDVLNGGAGLTRGTIRITDRSGASAEIDLRTALTVNDVLTAINKNTTIDVRAEVHGDRFRLVDVSGGSGNLRVDELGSTTAASLGLAGVDTAANSVDGQDVVRLFEELSLSRLNDGHGIRFDRFDDDLEITFRDNSDPLKIDFNTLAVLGTKASGTTNAAGGINAQITFTAVEAGSDFDGVVIQFQDNASVTAGNETVAYDDVNKTLTFQIDAGNTTADQVIAALAADEDASAVFAAATVDGGNGNGLVDVADTAVTSGPPAKATTPGTLDANAQITFTAVTPGSTLDGVQFQFVDDAGVTQGNETIDVDLSGSDPTITIRIDAGNTTANDVIAAFNADAAASAAFTAAPTSGSDGTGVVSTSDTATSSGGAIVEPQPANIELTLGDVLATLNSADPTRLSAAISADGERIELTDLTADAGGSFTVRELNGSRAAYDLGLVSPASAETLSGRRIFAGLNTTLLSSLNGGQGLSDLGQIQITDRSGATATVDLSGAAAIDDVLEAINDAAVAVVAQVNTAGNGIEIVDASGATTNNLIVANADATNTADQLNIAVDDTVTSINSGSLERQTVSENTTLAELNGGAGVASGTLTITDSSGQSAVLDLSPSEITTVGDVLIEIGRLGIGVEARINDTGDGILLVDTAGGATTLSVAEGNRTAARDLRLLGEAETIDFGEGPVQVIDGTTTATFELDTEDTLDDLVQQIVDADLGISATTFNDGSAGKPVHLLLTSDRAGKAGELLVDTSQIALAFSETAAARDARLLFGSPDNTNLGVLATSNTNTFGDVLPDVSLKIQQSSSSPVTVTVGNTNEALVEELQEFVADYNEIRTRLAELTAFDVETGQKGILVGDSAALRLDVDFSNLLSGVFSGAGTIRSLETVGISIESDGTLTFDENRFQERFAEDSDSVREFFITEEFGFADRTTALVDQLAAADNSLLLNRIESLAAKVTANNSRIEFLNEQLEGERERLLNDFIRMEQAIAEIQNALSSISTLAPLPILF